MATDSDHPTGENIWVRMRDGLAAWRGGGADEGAGDSYQRAIRSRAEAQRRYQELGAARSKLELWSEAVDAYQFATELDPNSAPSYRGLGTALSKVDRLKRASVAYERAIELDPGHAESIEQLGEALVGLERWDAALAVFDSLISVEPAVSWFHHHRGRALAELERWDEALAAYDSAIALEPTASWSHHQRGDALKRLERDGEAEAAYEQAVVLDPDRWLFHRSLGDVRAAEARWELAAAAYLSAFELAHEEMVDTPASDIVRLVVERIVLHAAFFPAYRRLGRLLEESGQGREASSCVEQACRFLEVIAQKEEAPGGSDTARPIDQRPSSVSTVGSTVIRGKRLDTTVYKTDKLSDPRLLRRYEAVFKRFLGRPVTLLELGVYLGAEPVNASETLLGIN